MIFPSIQMNLYGRDAIFYQIEDGDPDFVAATIFIDFYEYGIYILHFVPPLV